MPLSIFYGTIYLRALPLRGICICSDTSIEKSNFFMCFDYQLDIAPNLEMGACAATLFLGTQ